MTDFEEHAEIFAVCEETADPQQKVDVPHAITGQSLLIWIRIRV